MDEANERGHLSIVNCILQLRQQRPLMVQTSVRLSLSIMEESFYACYLLKRTFENKLNISNDCIENINMTVKVNRNLTSMELLIMSCRMSTTFYTKR